jgi:RimJ/RimL family protein N-acetyltransferase
MNALMKLEPVTLSGRFVRLEPLSEAHLPDLASVGLDERIWHFMRYGAVRSESDIGEWIKLMLSLQEAGHDLPFAVVHLASGKAIGATRFMDLHSQDRNLEIGGTWYGIEYQRTAVNTESKYLLLRHAFEVLSCIRVFFKTDLRNERSQRAIERLGAVREGVMRNNMILPDGYVRSSVFYSILVEEWPAVKANLEGRMYE